jgi:hypothetical protein
LSPVLSPVWITTRIIVARVLGPMIAANGCEIGLLRIYGLFKIRPLSISQHRPMLSTSTNEGELPGDGECAHLLARWLTYFEEEAHPLRCVVPHPAKAHWRTKLNVLFFVEETLYGYELIYPIISVG